MNHTIGTSLVILVSLIGYAASWAVSKKLFQVPAGSPKRICVALFFGRLAFSVIGSVATFIAATSTEAAYFGVSGMYDVELVCFMLVGAVIAFLSAVPKECCVYEGVFRG